MARAVTAGNLRSFTVLTIANVVANVFGSCPTGYFQCDGGSCIFSEWRCDFHLDCSDNSDEKNCPTRKSCASNDFTCDDGSCILKSWRCDGEYDCSDSSDEKGCNCTIAQWKCPNGLCISNRWRCDGDNDCGDMSDERGCLPTPPAATAIPQCKSYEFLCSNNLCIPNDWVCDGHDDCADNSDEVDSICLVRTCASDQFSCNSGQCIYLTWKCDGDTDCEDKSDEATCLKASVTPPPSQCPNKFECSDKKLCISLSWRCDTEPDCYDSSDELNCDNCPGGFLCTDKQCLLSSKKCDGTPDCSGGEDEAGCSTTIPTQHVCTASEIKCDSRCVAESQLCDGTDDCSDGSDEAGCSNECEQGTHNCSRNEICVDDRNGFHCDCKSGYQRDTTTKLCRSVKQCATITGLCDHLCIDTATGFKCDCYPHFQLFGTSSCKLSGFDPYLVYVYNRVINTMSFTSENRKIIVSSLRSPLALDYNYAEQKLYFSDNFLHKIFVTNLDGSGTPTVLVEGDSIDSPDGLAYDWINRVLYWTDGHMQTVEAYHFRTRRRWVLFNTSLDEPRAIIVDPLDGVGYIYFTDWGSPAKIEKATVNGDARTSLVTETVGWPNGLTLDIYRRHIYWIDAKLKHIKRVNVDGTNIVTIQLSSSFHPYALTSFDNKLFWTDWDKEGIMEVTMRRSGVYQSPNFVRNNLDRASLSIKSVHSHRQPTMADYVPCKVNNGGCSHVCNEVNFQAECHCPEGLSLFSDRKTCISLDTTECPTSYNFCYNNGTCVAGSSLSCKCDRHYSGPRCENLVSSPCEINNGGCDQICVNGRQGLVICKCRENYNLLSDFKTCLLSDLFQCPDYCEHGVCTEGPREPQCKCDTGYVGVRCNTKIQAVSTPAQQLPTEGSSNEKRTGSTGTTGTMGIAVGAAIGVVVIAAVIIILIVVRRRKLLRGRANFDNPIYTNKANEVTMTKKPVEKDDTVTAVSEKPSGTFI